jgi:hypothetical protein
MKKWTVFAWILAVFAFTACGDVPVDSEPAGGMRMALVAPGPNGIVYRLRDAGFAIRGPASLDLDVESDPDASVLSTDVPAGNYEVSLAGAYRIEQIDGDRVETVNSVLISDNPQLVSVASRGSSDVVFVFQVNNLPVRFEPGTLNVGVEVLECDGSPGQWQGCRGNGCAVCTELLVDFPLYVQNHPGCVANATCDGQFFTCNDRCPAPTDADRAEPPLECNGTPGEWQGCRGTGCWVCAEQLVGYPRYAQNHPRCLVNNTCDGLFFTCNADCPAPTEMDR